MRMEMAVNKRPHGTQKRKIILGVRISGKDKNNQRWRDGEEKYKILCNTFIANVIMISNTIRLF